MALSFVGYPGQTGVTTDYAVPFSFIDRSHVTAAVDGATASFTWLNDGMIRMDVAPVGDLVIKRNTPDNAKVVTFVDGSTHSAEKHNTQNDQVLFVSQETKDALGNQITGDGLIFDAANKRLQNLADPENAQDAVNKRWAETGMASELAQAIAAKAAAQTSESNAATSESNASTSEGNAASSASAAAASAVAADATNKALEQRYLGSKASNPSLDNEGNALIVGALYWNSISNEIRVYTGSAWQTFMTGAQIKALYEAEVDTNALTDGLLAKLNDIEANADVTDATNVAAAGALMKTGGTMTGALLLSADPTALLGAATKQYVDSTVVYTFGSRAAAEAATVPSIVKRITVEHADTILSYVKDGSGTALTTADGQKWSPSMDRITALHWGAWGDGITDDTAAINSMLSWVGSINGNAVFLSDAKNTFGARVCISGVAGKVHVISSELSLTGSHKNVDFHGFHLKANGGSWAATDFLVNCGGLATYVQFFNCQFNCQNKTGGVKLRARGRFIGGWVDRVANIGIECAGSDVWVDRAIIGQWTTNDVEYYDPTQYTGTGIKITESDARITSCTVRWTGKLIHIEHTNNIIQHCHMFNGMKGYVAADRNTALNDDLDTYFGWTSGTAALTNMTRRTEHIGIDVGSETGASGKTWANTFDNVYFDNCHHKLYVDGVHFNRCKFGSKYNSSLNTEDDNNPGLTNPAYNDAPTLDYWIGCFAYEANTPIKLRITEPESYVTSAPRHWVKWFDNGFSWAADMSVINSDKDYNWVRSTDGKQLGDGFSLGNTNVMVGDSFQGPLQTWFGLRDNVRIAMMNNSATSPTELRLLGDEFQIRPKGVTEFKVSDTGAEITPELTLPNGVTFNGGTDVFNAYEAGTYSPNVMDASGNSITFTKDVNYLRIGDMVMVFVAFANNIDTTGLVATDELRLSLPFTASKGAFSTTVSIPNANVAGPYSMQAVQGQAYAKFRVLNTTTTLLVSDIQSGVTDIQGFTLIYQA